MRTKILCGLVCLSFIIAMGCKKKEETKPVEQTAPVNKQEAPKAEGSTTEFSETMPSVISGKSLTTGGKTNVEFINKVDLASTKGAKFSKNEKFVLNGWAIDDQSKTSPATVIIQLTSTSTNASYYVGASRYNRGDVINFFKDPAYQKAGIMVTTDAKSLPPGTYAIKVIQVGDNGPIITDSKRVIELN